MNITKAFFILGSLAFMVSCGQPQEIQTAMPEDLEGLKAMQRDIKSQIQDLTAQLDEVEEKIVTLDPTLGQKSVLVTLDTVDINDFEHFVEVQASVQSEDVARISTEMGGRIVSIPVKEGQKVRKGQLLARIDASQMEKQMEELETALSLAEDVFTRQEKLWQQNIGSEIQYLEAKNNVDRLKKSKASLQNQMSKANIYAPMNGVVEAVLNEVGEMAAPGYPVVQLVDVNNLKVVADLPENYLTAVKRGEDVGISIPALNEQIDGSVSLVGQTIDPSNRTFKVEAKIKNQNGILKPNLLAHMLINDYTVEDVIHISADLVQQEVGGKNFVYVARQEEGEWKANKVYIEIGESGDNRIVVKTGLNKGDKLIVEGAFNVTDGDKIQITAQNI
jgi:RND family efflux transporter MFP subunit